MEIVSHYVHKDEGHTALKSSLLTAAGDFQDLCEDLHTMFTGDEEKPPRCTSADYSRGYYQILKKSLASHGEDFGYRSEDSEPLFCWQQQSPEEEATVIANAMKKMQHVMEFIMEMMMSGRSGSAHTHLTTQLTVCIFVHLLEKNVAQTL
jgi:hypothetical protein